MADVPEVGITDGVPTSGTGTVMTLSVIAAKLDIAITALQIIDNMVLAAGTANIGDVDVLSVVTGTGATALGKAIDAAAGGSDTGVAVLAVRDDSLGALTPAEGDYVPLRVDANGYLHVIIAPSQVPVVGQSTMSASSPVTMASDQTAVPVNEQDGLAVSGSVTSAATLFTSDMTGYASISVQVTSAGTSCTISYETSDDNSNWLATVGILSSFTGAASAGVVNSSTAAGMWQFPKRGRYFRARVSSYSSGTVSVVGSLSKVTVIPTLQAHIGAFLGSTSVEVYGPVAHDGAGTANPVRVAARAFTTMPAAVSTTGDICNLVTSMVGQLVTKPYSTPESDWTYAAAAGGIDNTTTAVTIQAAGGAGLRNYVTRLGISTNGALGAGTEIAVRDGAAGTVLWRMGLGTAGLPNGFSVVFPTPIRGTAATLLEVITLTATITGKVYVNAGGYIAP